MLAEFTVGMRVWCEEEEPRTTPECVVLSSWLDGGVIYRGGGRYGRRRFLSGGFRNSALDISSLNAS